MKKLVLILAACFLMLACTGGNKTESINADTISVDTDTVLVDSIQK